MRASPCCSQVARVEHTDGSALLYLSGQIAEGAGRAEQTRGAFETIAALPGAHGATLADVIDIRTDLTESRNSTNTARSAGSSPPAPRRPA
ncbi:hypothetical protein [Streptomyces brasiliensis]|uniref:Uncharacterized protein n=1 Tax=Streptomyces brasiliensis TaxID=1954 RepID=A0A917KJM2_9ACTN|nr:hypothetical protein [Streptomyces brasiliensis]GGJ12422.1 hypothetical protein GCM10010121_023530 [Streptomyces brasiliensis]